MFPTFKNPVLSMWFLKLQQYDSEVETTRHIYIYCNVPTQDIPEAGGENPDLPNMVWMH